MSQKLLFDFQVNKENNTMTIKREFAADQQTVWDCHTKSELLDKWFAPQPLITRTKTMNFTEGGTWVYAMIDPTGAEYWARMDYVSINPITNYTCLDGFCDDKGELNPHVPRARWDVKFRAQDKHSVVETVVSYDNLESLETVINMGMEEGLKSTLSKLDELIETLK